jgi:hypothetical protein
MCLSAALGADGNDTLKGGKGADHGGVTYFATLTNHPDLHKTDFMVATWVPCRDHGSRARVLEQAADQTRLTVGYARRASIGHIGALVSIGRRRLMATRISAWRISSGATPHAGKADAMRAASRPALNTSSRLAPATAA